tara:strand:- start:919 stop:1242 length:324 start_codon:yes stop_codon:yes gene_type:complete
MSNLDNPAMPTRDLVEDCGIDGNQGPYLTEINAGGFTKRERACIDLRIPESGDPELDALIEKARWRGVVANIAAGLAANHTVSQSDVAVEAVHIAENVMHQLERTDG